MALREDIPPKLGLERVDRRSGHRCLLVQASATARTVEFLTAFFLEKS